jgi:hypothetical protein
MSLLQKVLEGAVGADFFASLERTVVTVNLKRLSPNAVTSYWIATRLLSNGTINQIFQLQFPQSYPHLLAKMMRAEFLVK